MAPRCFLPALLALTLALACSSDGRPGAREPDASVPPRTDAGPGVRPTDSGVPNRDAGTPSDSGMTTRQDSRVMVDAGGSCSRPAPTPPASLTRGRRWVAENPMFISGLTVRMGAPPRHFVDTYFDDFHANAVHTWETGLPVAMDEWRRHGREAGRGDISFVSWVHADGTSLVNHQLAGGYPANVPGLIGYQVGDEPRSMMAFDEIMAGARALRAHDPAALTILNFSHLADDLDQMLEEYGASEVADVISMDAYESGRSHYGRLAPFREAGLRHGLPYWRYVNSYTGSGPLTAGDMRWHLNIGFVYGYTGVTWFIYQIRLTDNLGVFFDAAETFDAAPTEHFHWAAQLNQEAAHMGRAVTQLTSTDVRYIADLGALAQPPGTTAWAPGAGDDPFLVGVHTMAGRAFQDVLLGFFRDWNDRPYVMVQNVNHENGSFPTDGDDPATIRLIFDFASETDGCFDTSSVIALDHRTGMLETLPISEQTLDLRLEPGDVKLFKYDDAYPFAGYVDP